MTCTIPVNLATHNIENKLYVARLTQLKQVLFIGTGAPKQFVVSNSRQHLPAGSWTDLDIRHTSLLHLYSATHRYASTLLHFHVGKLPNSVVVADARHVKTLWKILGWASTAAHATGPTVGVLCKQMKSHEIGCSCQRQHSTLPKLNAQQLERC